MTMFHTRADARMLALLTDEPQRASELGAQLWGTRHRKPQSYARPAGLALARLSAQGYARSLVVRVGVLTVEHDYVGWVRTALGKARNMSACVALQGAIFVLDKACMYS